MKGQDQRRNVKKYIFHVYCQEFYSLIKQKKTFIFLSLFFRKRSCLLCKASCKEYCLPLLFSIIYYTIPLYGIMYYILFYYVYCIIYSDLLSWISCSCFCCCWRSSSKIGWLNWLNYLTKKGQQKVIVSVPSNAHTKFVHEDSMGVGNFVGSRWQQQKQNTTDGSPRTITPMNIQV